MAISIKNIIGQFTKENVSLKWPNDIYVDTKKIAGILIENQWKGSNIIRFDYWNWDKRKSN